MNKNSNTSAHDHPATQHERPTHAIELPDGRTLAFEEFGRPEGKPVVLLPSAPGSRYLDPDPRATAAADVRLLVVDRPGYGASSPLPAGATPSWAALADDLSEALHHLEIRRASVVGWSNGGIGALALAARHPALVESVAIVGTPAPNDEVPWVPEEFRGLLDSLRGDPASAVSTLAPILAGFAEDPAAALSSIAVGPADERTLTRPGVRDALEAMLTVALDQGALGMATDIVATNVAAWALDLGSIEAPVQLWYGDGDVIIPPAHGAYYASQIDGTTVEAAGDAGHLVLIERWAEILAGLEQPRAASG